MPSDVPPLATVGRGIRLCSLLSMYVYIRHKRGPIPHPHRELRRRRRPHRNPVRRCRATGRDTDVRRTWVAFRRVWPHGRHGAPLYVFGAVLKLGASARIWRCSCASLPVERRPISPDFPPLSTTMDNQGFFASKGSVCWSLLGSGAAVFARWTASCCSANPMNTWQTWPQRHPDYTGEANLPERLRRLRPHKESKCQQDLHRGSSD